MTGWIESIIELTNAGQAELTLSLSDIKYLIPETRICYILVFFAIFMIFCVWDDMRSEDRHDQESDIDHQIHN
jgi:hypothetical protein